MTTTNDLTIKSDLPTVRVEDNFNKQTTFLNSLIVPNHSNDRYAILEKYFAYVCIDMNFPEIWNFAFTQETHFVYESSGNSMVTTRIELGAVPVIATTRKVYTSHMPINSDHINIDLRMLAVHLIVYPKGALIIIKRFKNNCNVDKGNKNTCMVYTEHWKECPQMWKCFHHLSIPSGLYLRILAAKERAIRHVKIARNADLADIEMNPGPDFANIWIWYCNNWFRGPHLQFICGVLLFFQMFCLLFVMFFLQANIITYLLCVATAILTGQGMYFASITPANNPRENQFADPDEFKRARDSSQADIEVNPGPDYINVHPKPPHNQIGFGCRINKRELRICNIDSQCYKCFLLVDIYSNRNAMPQMDMFKIGALCKSIDSAKEDICKLPEKFKEIAEQLPKDFLSQLSLAGDATIILLAFSYGIDFVINRGKNSRSLTLAISALGALKYGPEIYMSLSALIKSKVYTKREPKGFWEEDSTGESRWIEMAEPQMDIDEMKNILKEFFVKFCEYMPNINMKIIKDYMYLLSGFERAKDGVLAIATWLFEQIDKICLYIFKRKIVPISWYKNTIQEGEIQRFLESYEKFTSDITAGKIKFTCHTFAILKDLAAVCSTLKLSVSRNAGSSSVLDHISKELNSLKGKFQGIIREFERAEPSCILFRSCPGVFKSTISMDMARKLASYAKGKAVDPLDYISAERVKFSKNDKEVNPGIYARQIANKYMDGYCGQTVFLYDDFGQTRDVAGATESEFREMIALKNTIPYQCHMAAIEDKKDTYFESPYVIVTTNVEKFDPQSIVDVNAVERRWDFDVILTLKPRFCVDGSKDVFSRTADPSKMPKLPDGSYDLKPEMFEFHVLDRKTGKRTLKTYNELLVGMIEKRSYYEGIFNANKDFSESEVISEADKFLESMGLSPTALRPTVNVTNNRKAIVENISLRPFYNKIVELEGEPCYDFTNIILQCCQKHGNEFVIDIMALNDNFQLRVGQFIELIPKIDNIGDRKTLEECIEKELQPEKSRAVEIREYIQKAAPAIGVASFIAIFIGIYNQFCGEDEAEAVEQSTDKPNMKPREKYRTLQQIKQEYAQAVTQAVTAVDQVADDQARSLNMSNAFTMEVTDKHLGSILFIRGNIALMPCHYLKQMDAQIRSGDGGITRKTVVRFYPGVRMHADHSGFSVSVGELLDGMIYNEKLESSDLVLVQFPGYITPRKDIVDRFKRKTEFRQFYNSVLLAKIKRKNKYMEYTKCLDTKCEKYVRHFATPIQKLDQTYLCSMISDNGDCGSLLFELNPKSKNKIIGMHVAAWVPKNQALAAAVYREDLEEALNGVPVMISEIEDKAEYQCNLQAVCDGRFAVLGKGNPVKRVTNTSIIRSQMCGIFHEPRYFPAVLRPTVRNGQTIDPFMKALSKYNFNSGIHVDVDHLEKCMDSEVDFYLNVSLLKVEARALTNEETVRGLEDSTDFSPMSRQTSPGYPYVHEKVGKGKTMWLGTDGDYTLDSEHWVSFMQDIERFEEQLSRGILPEFIFVDNLKDELRKKSKIEEVKTRNFSAGSMSLVYLFRKYFGSFIDWFHKNRLQNGSAIGINPYSNEWDLLARMLQKLSEVIHAGDFAGFDTSHAPQISHALYAIPRAFYKDDLEAHNRIRETLWLSVVASYHLVEDAIVRWDAGLPSGHVLTAILNSMYNRVVHKLCFADATHDYDRSFWVFNKDVVLITFGDDSLMSVVEKYRVHYNENSLGPLMLKYGLVYTPEDKSAAEFERVRSLEDVTFLKRGFSYCSQVAGYVAPLNEERVKESLNWTKMHDPLQITKDKVQWFLREMALHGKKKFNSVVGIVNQAHYNVFREFLTCTSYNVYLTEVLNSVIDYETAQTQMNLQTNTNYACEALHNHSDVVYPITVNQKSFWNFLFSRFSKVKVSEINCVPQMDAISVPEVTPPAQDAIQEDDAPVVEVSLPMAVRSGRLRGTFTNGQGFSEIARALKRLTPTTTGVFASTDGPTTFPMWDWSNNLTATQIANKLQGVYIMKADLIVHLEVNANHMQQGLYRLYFVPTGGLTGGTAPADNWLLMHRFSKAQVSQCPGVWFNVGCDTRVSLRIPWRSGLIGFVPNASRFSSPGIFHLYPFVPIATAGGSSTCSFTIWCQYDNVELGAAATPQMGRIKKDILGQEQDSGKPSQILLSVANAADAFSGIPLLSSITTPISIFANAAANVAMFFGFSKPSYVGESNKVVKSYAPYLACADGVDMSEPLSLLKENRVSISGDLYGTDLDEMSVDFISQVSTWIETINWPLTAVTGTSLYFTPVAPAAFGRVVSDGVVSLTNHSTLSWLAEFFQHWRGSITFNVKLAKTQFHSGRLLIIAEYFDSDLSTPALPTITSSVFNYKTVVDIRECDEFEITVPYVCNKPWLTRGRSIGRFSILVLDPLVAPAIVPSSINMVITVKGGRDFAVATPYSPGQEASELELPCRPAAYQMDKPCVLKETTIGGTSIIDETDMAREICMGEKVLSLRQMLKTFQVFSVQSLTGTSAQVARVLPFVSEITVSNGLAAGLPPHATLDIFTHLSCIYALNRGGVRMLVVPTVPAIAGAFAHYALERVAISSSTTVIQTAASTVRNTLLRSCNSPIRFFNYNEPYSAISIPQNTMNQCRFSGGDIIYNGTAIGSYVNDNTVLRVSTTSTVANLAYRAGADDASFGCFVSIPPYFTHNVPA